MAGKEYSFSPGCCDDCVFGGVFSNPVHCCEFIGSYGVCFCVVHFVSCGNAADEQKQYCNQWNAVS